MLREGQAAFSFQLGAAGDGVPPQWVHLLPAGTFSGRDGRGPYHLKDAAAVISASMAEGPLPLDYDHTLVYALGKGGTAPAAGWIVEMQARDDGLWGRVEWTERAAAQLKAREYRFISPVFTHAKDGAVLRVEHASLVNAPNPHLTAVAARGAGNSGDPDMKTLAQRLAALFGLPETADEAAVEAHAKTLVESVAAHGAQLGKVATALGLKADAGADAIAAHAATVAAGAEPDPAKYVPIAAHDELKAQVAQLLARQAEDDAAAAVNAAMAEGKVTPAQKDWATAYARKDLAGFRAYVAAAPVIVAPGASAHAAGTPPVKRQMDDEARAVALRMGLDPEAMAKTMAEG